MVFCVAYNCTTRSGQGIGLFTFPKDVNRRRLWVTKVKRKDFVPSANSRLCAKHFKNDQFTVNPLFASSIGYQIKKLSLKPDAVPTEFNYTVKSKEAEGPQPDSPKRKSERQSGAIRKRKRIEQQQEYAKLMESQTCEHGEVEQLSTSQETVIERTPESLPTPDCSMPLLPERFNAYIQTVPIGKRHIGTQTDFEESTCARTTSSSTRECETENENITEEDLSDESDREDQSRRDPDWTPKESMEEIGEESDSHPTEITADKERKFIVFESKLDELLEQHCICCGEKRKVSSKRVLGTGVCVVMTCRCDKHFRWDSQPMSGTMPIGNLLIAGAIMFTGGSISKTLTFLRHSAIQCFSDRTYHYLQNAYLLQAVTDVWQIKQADMLSEIQAARRTVNLGGDARCCSPGHTAKYGSYSLMDLDTNQVLDVQLVQSNEVANSYAMEMEGLKRCLSYLDENQVQIQSLVTDRHSQVKKYMREKRPEINHMFDVWHVAKGVYKKLEAIGKSSAKKKCDVVGRWARSISNHMYWCAASSDGDGEMVQQKWFSILNHVANIHEGHGPKFPACQHTELNDIDREWIKKGSKAYEALEKVVKGRLLSKDIMKLSPAQQTSSLESYHRVVCFFAPKFLHFFHATMEARLFLSALHFNENACRSQARTLQGTPQFRISYPKGRRGEGIAKEVKTCTTYGYIDDLMGHLLFGREHLPTLSQALENRKRLDRQRPKPLTHSFTTPKRPKEDIVRAHVSRFNFSDN